MKFKPHHNMKLIHNIRYWMLKIVAALLICLVSFSLLARQAGEELLMNLDVTQCAYMQFEREIVVKIIDETSGVPIPGIQLEIPRSFHCDSPTGPVHFSTPIAGRTDKNGEMYVSDFSTQYRQLNILDESCSPTRHNFEYDSITPEDCLNNAGTHQCVLYKVINLQCNKANLENGEN